MGWDFESTQHVEAAAWRRLPINTEQAEVEAARHHQRVASRLHRRLGLEGNSRPEIIRVALKSLDIGRKWRGR